MDIPNLVHVFSKHWYGHVFNMKSLDQIYHAGKHTKAFLPAAFKFKKVDCGSTGLYKQVIKTVLYFTDELLMNWLSVKC